MYEYDSTEQSGGWGILEAKELNIEYASKSATIPEIVRVEVESDKVTYEKKFKEHAASLARFMKSFSDVAADGSELSENMKQAISDAIGGQKDENEPVPMFPPDFKLCGNREAELSGLLAAVNQHMAEAFVWLVFISREYIEYQTGHQPSSSTVIFNFW